MPFLFPHQIARDVIIQRPLECINGLNIENDPVSIILNYDTSMIMLFAVIKLTGTCFMVVSRSREFVTIVTIKLDTHV